MSSILKALRKVENEKASLGEGSVDLAHDILKRSFEVRRSFPLNTVLLIAILLFSAGGIGWFFLQTEPQKGAQLEETQLPEGKELALTPAVQQSLPLISVPVVQRRIDSELQEVEPVVVATLPVQIVETSIPATMHESPIILPSLRIEEIVFHQQADARLAVINDLPVMEGTVIEGAKIEEIFADHVQFSFRGVFFNKTKSDEY